ncbi:Calcium-binding ef hand family protein [Thalictrum thalictroides]|uniref:Calcium-binding ef hand family protein n=1 Tax=Thalictrum thalictroides TaxID=46969 RepID=A0A7J6WCY5_THATH|nr:Calcium-binding ef hand family protein [Thalictrum thalictroides]
MGQVLTTIQDNFQGKEWKQRQLRKITDRVFDRFKDEAGKANLAFEDLYIAVLLVYNDLNKHLPGPHFDPPTKAQVKAAIEAYDVNLDGELDREEFAGFIKKLTSDMLSTVSQGLIIALVAAPTVALLTKRATEGVPGVGKVVQKIPSSVYASLVTLAIVFLQKEGMDVE